MQTTLSDLDRRTIAHAPNPQSISEITHALRVDPYTKTRSEDEVFDHLNELVDRGLLVDLGEISDPGKAIAKLPKRALEQHDETARNYEANRLDPRGAWRLGRSYVLSQDGMDALVAVPDDAPPPLTESALVGVIKQEARRLTDRPTEAFSEEGGESLADAVLAEEFKLWLERVLEGHEKAWGKPSRDSVRQQVQRFIPIAGGAGWSDLYSRLIVDHENQKTALPALAAPWYMALLTTAPTDATAYASLVEAAYTGYARKSVAAADMNAASGAPGAATNANAIIFAACTGSTSTVIAFANVADASGSTTTAGFRKWATCASTVISTTQTPAQFAAGAYSTSAD